MKSQEKKMKINKNKMNDLENLFNSDSKLKEKSINNLDSQEKKEKINFPNIYSNTNLLTPSQKLMINHSKILNLNMKKINKLYVSDKPKNSNTKNSNEYNKINALSKISKRDFSNKNNGNKILEALNNSSNYNINKLELSKLNSSKDENSIFNNLTKRSINYLKSINKNELSGLNELKNKYDNLTTDNKSYFNALSENNSNNNTNITTQRKNFSNRYIKTDMNNDTNNMNIISQSDKGLKLFFPNKNNLDKKYIMNRQTETNNESPIKLGMKLKKELLSKKVNNIKTIKSYKRNEDEPEIIDKIGHSYNKKDLINKNIIIINSNNFSYFNNDYFSCPEELHFYYINSIQRGKINENKF